MDPLTESDGGNLARTEVLRYAAFTDSGHGGNPAGVVLDAAGLGEKEMLGIAAEIGFSETAFVVGPAPGGWRVRYFSPRAEVDFCGHATIATAVALADRDGPGEVTMATAAGPVVVTSRATHDGTTATLVSVPPRTTPADPDVVGRALDALRWRADELDPAYPVHVAFAGVNHLVVPAGSRERLAALDYDYPALERLMAAEGWTTVHLFWREDATTYHVRNPFPPGGVVEDPATGAAAAAFGGYLRALGIVDPPATLTLLQGHDMGAPSRLLVDVAEGTGGVAVTGRATRMPED
jgi:PhzF family phenazine biosynthesis protein